MGTLLSETPGADSASPLESHFPHILERLRAAWHSTEETERFLNEILLDTRDGRQGLPEEVFSELMFLAELNWTRRHFNAEGVEFVPDDFSFGGH